MQVLFHPVDIVATESSVSILAKTNGFVRTTFSKIEVPILDGAGTNIKVTIKESDLEELIRRNVEWLSMTDEDESKDSMLIIGQQTANAAGGRLDLVAIDSKGAIVLIELKRDMADMVRRPEPMELQAIRYAASLSIIQSKQELIDKLFAPYVAKHLEKLKIVGRDGLTERQIAEVRLNEFLSANKIEDKDVNRTQRVVLLASEFDDQTLSACAWLCKNNVDIRCLALYPMQFGDGTDYLIAVEQIIPPPALGDFLVGITKSGGQSQPTGDKMTRTTLPKLPQLIEWRVVDIDDELMVNKDSSQLAKLKANCSVECNGVTMSINAWAKQVTGWSAVNIYQWVTVVSKGKTLDVLRAEKMKLLQTGEMQ
jgi:hypothetical protein